MTSSLLWHAIAGVIVAGALLSLLVDWRTFRRKPRPSVPVSEVRALIRRLDERERLHPLPHSDLVARAAARAYLRLVEIPSDA